jgi:hypothetical protein
VTKAHRATAPTVCPHCRHIAVQPCIEVFLDPQIAALRFLIHHVAPRKDTENAWSTDVRHIANNPGTAGDGPDAK